MAVAIPCPQCGKMLKLLESVLGKTIRCPGCQKTFKAPPAAPADDPLEVLPATPSVLSQGSEEAPVLEAVEGDASAARQFRRSRPTEERKPATPKRGCGVGVLLGIAAVVLVLCGGFGTLAFFVGKAIMDAPANPNPNQNANLNPNQNPNPNPNQNPNPNPQPNIPPKRNPKPNPNPTPTLTPGQESLKLIGDRLTTHNRGTQMVRTIPNGKELAAVGEDGVVKLLELPPFGTDSRIYQVRRTLPAIEGPFRDLAFHASSQMAVVAGDRVHIYNSFDGTLTASLTYKEPIAAAFNPSGTKLAIAVRKPGDEGSEIHLWDTWRKADNGKPLKLAGKVRDMAWPSGTYDLAVAVDGEVRLYHTPDRDWRYHHTIATGQGTITGLAFPQNGQSLVTIGGDKTIKRWSQKDGKFLMAYEGHTNPIGRPAFTPDGSRMATLGGPGDESVRLWETATGKPLAQLINTPAQADNLDFLRDNRTLVIALRNQAVRIWNIGGLEQAVKTAPPFGKPTRPEEANRFNVPIAIHMVRFSPDGKTLAAADREGDLLLLNVADWSLRTTKSSTTPPRGRGKGSALTFAYGGDGRLVAAAGGGGSARVYLRNGASGALTSDFAAGDGWVRCLAVSPDGKSVAVGFESVPPPRVGQQPRPNAKSFVRMWDISGEPKPLGDLENLPYPLGSLAFAADGKTFYAAAGRIVRRWRTETREELPSLEGTLGDLSALAVASDGRVYAAGEDMLIHIWDAEGRHRLPLEGHRDGITGLALTTDGKRLASVSRDGTCRLWDTATGETTAVTEDKSQGGHVAVGLPTFSPDGSLLAVAADYHTVSVLRTDRVKGQAPALPVSAKKASSEPGVVAAIDPVKRQFQTPFFANAGFNSDSTLLTADSIGGLQRWTWPDGKLLDEKHHFHGVHTLARSRDGKVVALAAGNAVYLRDGDTGKLRACVPPPRMDKYPFARLMHIALAPEGDLLALALSLGNREGNELIVWDVKPGRQRAVARPKSTMTSLAFSPDGKTLAVGLSTSNCVALYDPRDLKEGNLLAKQKRAVDSVAFSPDGKRLATAGNDGLVKMWDLAEGKELWSKPWSRANAWRQSICFSPDGKWLVAAPHSPKQGLVLVDAANGELRTEVTRSPMPNSDPAFSPDGKFLAVVRKSPGQVVIYDVAKLLERTP